MELSGDSQTIRTAYVVGKILHACLLSCFSRVQLFAAPWTVACQAPESMGFFSLWSLPTLSTGCFLCQEAVLPFVVGPLGEHTSFKSPEEHKSL